MYRSFSSVFLTGNELWRHFPIERRSPKHAFEKYQSQWSRSGERKKEMIGLGVRIIKGTREWLAIKLVLLRGRGRDKGGVASRRFALCQLS